MPRSLASSTPQPTGLPTGESVPPPAPVQGEVIGTPSAVNPAMVATTPVPGLTPMEHAALPLTEPQRTALLMLTSGCTQIAAANAVGVARTTLHRWLRHDAAFMAAYHAWQQDVLATGRDQVLAGTRDALATVMAAIRAGNANLAWKMLQSQGITAPPTPGSTDVAELERGQALARRKKEVEFRKNEHAIEMDELFNRTPAELDEIRKTFNEAMDAEEKELDEQEEEDKDEEDGKSLG